MTKEECKELEQKVSEIKTKIAQYYVEENKNIMQSHECFIGKTYKRKDVKYNFTNYYKIVGLDGYFNIHRANAIKFSYPCIFDEYEILIEIISLPLWCHDGSSDEPTLKELTEISIEEYNEAFDKCVSEIKTKDKIN